MNEVKKMWKKIVKIDKLISDNYYKIADLESRVKIMGGYLIPIDFMEESPGLVQLAKYLVRARTDIRKVILRRKDLKRHSDFINDKKVFVFLKLLKKTLKTWELVIEKKIRKSEYIKQYHLLGKLLKIVV